MGNLFAAYQSPIEGSDKVNSYDKIMAYEEHYMKLLKHYLSEIQSIEKMLEDYITKNLEEFKLALEKERDKV